MAAEQTAGAKVVAVVAAREDVKRVKTALQQANRFARRISPAPAFVPPHYHHDAADELRQRFLLYTTVCAGDEQARSALSEIVPGATLLDVGAEASGSPAVAAASPLVAAVAAFLAAHPPAPPSGNEALIAEAPRRYNIYSPLLLLPPAAFDSPQWRAYLSSLPSTSAFYSALAAAFPGTTHVASNAPIPASDVMRAPAKLTPLYGGFGSATGLDFDCALWVATIQNGIHQTWAPQHSMFSRGNIKEKARVLGFRDVAGEEVADMYAGIGYFTFSYLKAGARRVWCWEINPWSVEALVRGCAKNGWSVRRIRSREEFVEGPGEEARCVVFEESNEFARERMRGSKVRHVNLGLLPTSRGSWETAHGLVASEGWVHVHENFAEQEVEVEAEDVRREFEKMEKGRAQGTETARGIACEHVERVKTFAPGVVHCVVDLKIG